MARFRFAFSWRRALDVLSIGGRKPAAGIAGKTAYSTHHSASLLKNYFFVVGYPRSGTTLISVLLDRHSRLCVPPETAFFDEVAPALTRRNNAVLLKVLGSWSRLGELHLEPEMVRQRLGKAHWRPAEVLAAILDLYALNTGKVRCGEKTPQHLLHVQTILEQFPNAKVICVLRDGREAVLSLNSMPWWEWGLAAAAELWQRNVRVMNESIIKYPGRFLTVRYEDVLADCEKELSRMMTYLDESPEPAQLLTETPSHVVLSRSMEWKGKALEPIDRHNGDRRRQEASLEELTFLEQVLGEDLRRCGYELASRGGL